jgi:hypothetical protein
LPSGVLKEPAGQATQSLARALGWEALATASGREALARASGREALARASGTEALAGEVPSLELPSRARGVKPGRQTHSATSLAPGAAVSELAGHEAQLAFSSQSL